MLRDVTYRPRVLDLVLDKHSTIPLYLQLKHHVVHLISSGAWQPGMPLPSVRQLAADLGMATATVQRTYGELQAQGLLLGRSGRGVYVADLTAGVPHLAAERTRVLQGLLARTISHAHSLGFAEDEILGAVRDMVGDRTGTNGGPLPRVVFVAPQSEFAEKYRTLLREALAGLDLEVESLLLADVEERGDEALDALEPIRCLVSMVGVFPDLRRLAGGRGTPLFGLVVDLAEESQHALVHLPDDEAVGLVAEERYLPSARALLRQYVAPEERVRWAAPDHRVALQRVLRECRVVVHTLGSKRVVEVRAREGTSLVELQYGPNPASLARLRTLLAADADPMNAPDTVPARLNGAAHTVRRRAWAG